MTRKILSDRQIGAWLLGLALSSACGADAPAGGSRGPDAAAPRPAGDGGPGGPAPDAALGADGEAEADEVELVRRAFGPLETLAGSGPRGPDTNDWQPGFEGGPATAADLSTPHNAMGDRAGNVYIADKDAHAIRKVTPDGKIVTVAGVNAPGDDGDAPGPGRTRHLSSPNGLWVKPDGTVFILDLGNGKVRRLATGGELTTHFAVPGLALGRGLWVSEDETQAFVASASTIVRWTRAGGTERWADGFRELGNLVVEPSGALLVTDRGLHQVFRVGADRQRVAIAGNGGRTGGGDGRPGLETGLDGVRGLWRHERGGLFLATHAGSQVWYLDTRGTIHLFLDGARDAHGGDGEPLSAPGRKVSEVRNVTMDPLGNLLVTENDVGFVRIARAVRR
jgi:hypothetical protein